MRRKCIALTALSTFRISSKYQNQNFISQGRRITETVCTLSILYRDKQYLAIHKPPGLFVHRNDLSAESISALQILRDQIGQKVWPVHRLDRATSGVLLFALDPESAAAAMKQWQEQRVEKIYLAAVRGWLPEQGCIDYPLKNLERPDLLQPAVTRFKRLHLAELEIASNNFPTSRCSLVSLHPQTGRRHQLRRHLAHLRHPIIGDVNYGDGAHNRLFREHLHSRRLLLHAYRLAFVHPVSGQTLTIQAEPDAEMSMVFERLGWNPLPSV